MRKRKKVESKTDETWLIPYADMLTLLLALFLVLYAMSTVNQEKFQELKQTLNAVFAGGTGVLVSDSGFTEWENDPLTQNAINNYLLEEKMLRECQFQVDEYLEGMGLSQTISTNLTKEGLLVTIQDVALFDSGKANVRPEADELLRYLGLILAEVDNHVQIRGHTDNLPINTREFPSNWELSVQRALNVMKKFTEIPNLDESRFSIVGYGEHRPIATNDTPEGRAQNRRVELLVERFFDNPEIFLEDNNQ
ncbi:MAG: OmpA family protein [Syntrophomonadaceae bacterium]|nr:OmpA family protein [Syntrophomonadaceae bacterium]